MATSFVFSGAVGANNGTSWTDAWTDANSSAGVAAGDVVKVHKTHSQTTLGANINWTNGTLSNPVKVICVDKDNGDALATGAVIGWNVTNLGPQGNIFAYGCTFTTSAANLRLIPGNPGYQRYENCTFSCAGVTGIDIGGVNRSRVDFVNCNVDFSGASNAGVFFSPLSMNGYFNWIGGTYTCRSVQATLINAPATFAGVAIFRGVTFSGTVTNLFSQSGNVAAQYRFDECVPPTYTNIYTGGAAPANRGHRINLDGFIAGTLSAALLRPTTQADYAGTISALTSRYRTGGANDGSQGTPQSWQMASNANANQLVAALESPPLVSRITAAGSYTLTVFVASGGTLNNDECWIEVISPSEAGSPTALGRFQSTRCAPLATPAALTTDSTSSWTGSGVGTKQKMSVTIAPTVAGSVEVRVCLAKPTTTIYVDPLVVFS